MKRSFHRITWLAAVLGMLSAGLSSAAPARVVILTGANNHQWQETTPLLKQMLEEGGAMQVDVITDPERLTAEFLADYEVLVSNWNTAGKNNNPPPWSEELKKNYVEFVRNGGGHVVVHGGSSSFNEWEDYLAIGLATWKPGQTRHKQAHAFELRVVDTKHPVTQGVERQLITDELWYNAKVHSGAKVLAESFSKTTEQWEPSVLVGTFGQGRCFTILLGHDAEKMNQDAFRKFLKQGTGWAASL
ncbi:hypothetical protein PDESU_02576 [Pontiella desulfatans]|uniref:ThuA-like domain-containing protein n=1 Tax=Pontiella desulfatans TaxID=2750659 RepID=A0A6C2U2J9_PONDE|nr:ThuA domain-containing protein [Pontiella desulfatans]VGO14019.1 hypothetical protein PDESU_02576 [Pontiella desulfatans]